eukprot:8938379-Pyramimonas_sp.AAC.1
MDLRILTGHAAMQPTCKSRCSTRGPAVSRGRGAKPSPVTSPPGARRARSNAARMMIGGKSRE